jgi:hypothetical protein
MPDTAPTLLQRKSLEAALLGPRVMSDLSLQSRPNRTLIRHFLICERAARSIRGSPGRRGGAIGPEACRAAEASKTAFAPP